MKLKWSKSSRLLQRVAFLVISFSKYSNNQIKSGDYGHDFLRRTRVMINKQLILGSLMIFIVKLWYKELIKLICSKSHELLSNIWIIIHLDIIYTLFIVSLFYLLSTVKPIRNRNTQTVRRMEKRYHVNSRRFNDSRLEASETLK